MSTQITDLHGTPLTVGDVCVYVPKNPEMQSDPDGTSYFGRRIFVRKSKAGGSIQVSDGDDIASATLMLWCDGSDLVRIQSAADAARIAELTAASCASHRSRRPRSRRERDGNGEAVSVNKGDRLRARDSFGRKSDRFHVRLNAFTRGYGGKEFSASALACLEKDLVDLIARITPDEIVAAKARQRKIQRDIRTQVVRMTAILNRTKDASKGHP